jgi:hypothetical protein
MPPPAGKYDFVVDPGNRSSTYGLICDRVPHGAAVLDIGCACGNLALALDQGPLIGTCSVSPRPGGG